MVGWSSQFYQRWALIWDQVFAEQEENAQIQEQVIASSCLDVLAMTSHTESSILSTASACLTRRYLYEVRYYNQHDWKSTMLW